MSDFWTDVLTLAGLALTAIGAAITARAVILSDEDAVTIGSSRYAPETFEEGLKLPAVQNLLKSSRAAKYGLLIIVLGTAMQIIPIALRLIW